MPDTVVPLTADKYEEHFRGGSWVGEAYRVLKEAKGPLNGQDLYNRIVERGAVKLSGQTPKNTLMGALSRQRQYPTSPFMLTSDGEHVLREYLDAVPPASVAGPNGSHHQQQQPRTLVSSSHQSAAAPMSQVVAHAPALRSRQEPPPPPPAIARRR